MQPAQHAQNRNFCNTLQHFLHTHPFQAAPVSEQLWLQFRFILLSILAPFGHLFGQNWYILKRSSTSSFDAILGQDFAVGSGSLVGDRAIQGTGSENFGAVREFVAGVREFYAWVGEL